MSTTNGIVRERVLHKLLERQAEKYGDRCFLYFEDRKYSFAELNEMANRVASSMQKLGISKGDKVAYMMENCPETLFLAFGLFKIGAIAVPLNTSHRGEVLEFMVNHSDASVLILQTDFISQLKSVLAGTDKIVSVVLVNREGGEDESLRDTPLKLRFASPISESIQNVLEWSELIDNDGRYLSADVIWSDPLMIMYTSGTTGVSKGVLLPHNLLYSTAETYYEMIVERQINEDDCIYVPNTLFHAQAWHAGIDVALLSGARVALAERFSARRYWEDIKKYGCTYTTAGGSCLPIVLLAEPQPDDLDNPLKVILGSSSEKVCREFEPRYGSTIVSYYGSTEVGMPIINRLSDRKLGTLGKRHPDFDLKIVNEEGEEVGVNMPGELLVRPRKPFMMMLEYFKIPDKTVEAWRDLWFHTGDNAIVGDDGYYRFVDRKKDSIRRRGENISSFEVERVINSHPAVLVSAAYGVRSDLMDDDEVMVSVEPMDGEAISPEELISHCEGQMAYFMIPRYIRFLKELPRNDVLRIEKYKLREDGVTHDTWDREKAGYKLKR